MFAFLSYNGEEPAWAKALRETDLAPGLAVYSPGIALTKQIFFIEGYLARKPNVLAYAHQEALRLDQKIWLELTEAQATLFEADRCADTHQMIFRDLYLLVRADVLIVEAGSTNELALMANLLGIPVVAISYTPFGIHPWLAHCAQVTVNSPTSVSQIIDVLSPSPPRENLNPIPPTPPTEEEKASVAEELAEEEAENTDSAE